ncbi:fluoride efflux transporter CrcB [Rhodococcus sp. NPDC056743]|uniref:fluoride efflux transporter CrcB n=1 Tax=Rhodococcus sp. NPDC056743 TaxID=3345934 RepID=UPI00366BB82B
MTVLLVAIGGGAGATGRYLLAKYVPAYRGFPAATFMANVLGCFLLGLFTGATLSTAMAALLATGFCGGLSTYSTFATENVGMLDKRQTALSLVYIIASLVVGLSIAWLGIQITG